MGGNCERESIAGLRNRKRISVAEYSGRVCLAPKKAFQVGGPVFWLFVFRSLFVSLLVTLGLGRVVDKRVFFRGIFPLGGGHLFFCGLVLGGRLF